MAKTGLARSTIYRHIELNTFPKPISLGGRASGWISTEIDEWIMDKIAERDGEAEL